MIKLLYSYILLVGILYFDYKSKRRVIQFSWILKKKIQLVFSYIFVLGFFILFLRFFNRLSKKSINLNDYSYAIIIQYFDVILVVFILFFFFFKYLTMLLKLNFLRFFYHDYFFYHKFIYKFSQLENKFLCNFSNFYIKVFLKFLISHGFKVALIFFFFKGYFFDFKIISVSILLYYGLYFFFLNSLRFFFLVEI